MFLDFATLDVVMSKARLQELSEDTLQHIQTVRNSVGHRLVSLPSWDDLGPDERKSIDSRAYELSRLTCVIYQNAVMFSLFPHRGWQNGLTGRLRWLISLDDRKSTANRGLDNLVIWCLCIGAIASYEGTNSEYFRKTLRERLSERYEDPSKQLLAVTAVLHTFVWSNEACDMGLQMVWNETFKRP